MILDTFLAPKTKSTAGARLMMSAPKCEAVQPVTPILAPSFLCFLNTPISEKSFATGFSRTEQVLIIIRSACDKSSVSS